MKNKVTGAVNLLKTQQKDTLMVRDNTAATAFILDNRTSVKKLVKTQGGVLPLKNPRNMEINHSATAVVKKMRQREMLKQRGVRFTKTEILGGNGKDVQSRYIKRRRQQEILKNTRSGVPVGMPSKSQMHTAKDGKMGASGSQKPRGNAGSDTKTDSKQRKKGKQQGGGNSTLIDREKRRLRYQSSLMDKKTNRKKSAKTGKQSIKKMLVSSGMEKMLSDGGKKDDLGTKVLSDAQKAYYKAKRAKGMVRAAYKGAKYSVKAASAVAKLIGKIVQVMLSVLSSIGLPFLLILIGVVLVAGVVMSFLGGTGATETDTDLSDAYLYVTQLDASITYRIRTENYGAQEYRYYLNGNRIEGAAIQIHTNIEQMLALMNAKYQTCALHAPIEGLWGGRTVDEELSYLHNALYQYTTSVNTITVDGAQVKVKSISVTTQLLESWVERNTWYLTKSEYDLFKVMCENGYFLMRKEIAPLFGDEKARIYQDYGYYVNPTGAYLMDEGTLLSVKKDIPVYAGFSGNVVELGADFIVMQTGIKEMRYDNLNPDAGIKIGDLVERGTALGKTSTNVMRVAYYKNGRQICPTIYLDGIETGTVSVGNSDIVAVALSQVGQVGGQPYWSWMGFGGRVEWCASFVSWCANQCGYIDSGVIFKHAGCTAGVAEWRRRGLFQEAGSGYVPKAGDIIYFDYNDPQYGKSYTDSDHVGIVQSSDGQYVYTIEGNSGDAVRQNTYSLGYADIKGYATPLYP